MFKFIIFIWILGSSYDRIDKVQVSDEEFTTYEECIGFLKLDANSIRTDYHNNNLNPIITGACLDSEDNLFLRN